MVGSIYSSAVCGQLWFFRSMQLHLTLLAVMLHMIDSLNFNLKSLHKQAVAVFAEVSTAVLLELILFTSSSFIDFRRISKKCISWRMLTKLQQGRW